MQVSPALTFICARAAGFQAHLISIKILGEPSGCIHLALVDAKTIPEITRIFDIASVLGEAARRANLSLATVNEVQLIRLDVEIKLGHELIRLKENGELHAGQPEKRIVVNNDNSFKLSDYGISRDLSSRSQTLSKHF